MEQELKKSWESKTLWIALINALIALFVPKAQALIADNPEIYATALSVVFMFLRKISKDAVVIK